MLKGHTFNLQTFTSEAFALFIDRFLNKKNGIAKGCGLSNTNTSVTIADGYFVVRGRFLQVISGVTLSNISNNGYYSLICEIDLTKTNTADTLNQAEIKTLYNASAYPTLIQEDITGDGTKFQYEFARFKVVNGAISTFTDTRTFVNFESIYDEIETESDAVLEDIRQALLDLEDESSVVLKDNFAVIYGTINLAAYTDSSPYGWTFKNIEYPLGFNSTNCIVMALGLRVPQNEKPLQYSYLGALTRIGVTIGNTTVSPINGSSADMVRKANIRQAILEQNNIKIGFQNVASNDIDYEYKLVLLKLPEVNIGAYELGDVNMDGQVTEADYTLVQQYIMGQATLNDKQYKLADVNEDGIVDSKDYMLIKNMVEGNS